MPEFDFGDVIGAQEERFAAQIWVYIPRKGHDARHEVCDIDSTVWEQHKKAIAESLAAGCGSFPGDGDGRRETGCP